MFEEARPVENTNYDRKVRENQRNEFKKILEEDQIIGAEELANALEQEAYNLSGGDQTRDYRTRVNTVKMRLKGTKGQLIRTVLVEKIMTPLELMQLDMSKLSEDSVQAFLQKQNKSIPQTNIKKPQPPQPPRGPPTRPPVSAVPPPSRRQEIPQPEIQQQFIEQQAPQNTFPEPQQQQQNPVELQEPKVQQSTPPPTQVRHTPPAQPKQQIQKPQEIEQPKQQEPDKPPLVKPPPLPVRSQESHPQQQNHSKLKEVSKPPQTKFLEDNQLKADVIMESNDFPNIEELRRNQERLNQLAEQLRSDVSDDGQATEKQLDFTPLTSQNVLEQNQFQGSQEEIEQDDSKQQIQDEKQESGNDEAEPEDYEQIPAFAVKEDEQVDQNNDQNNQNDQNDQEQLGIQQEQPAEEPQIEVNEEVQQFDAFKFESSQIEQKQQDQIERPTQTPKFTVQLQQQQSSEIDQALLEQMIQQRDQYYEKQLQQLANQNKELQIAITKFQQEHTQIINDLKQKNLNQQSQIQHLQNENQILKQNLNNQEQSSGRAINQLKEQILTERNQYQKLYEAQHQERLNDRHFIEKIHQNSQQRKDMLHKYRQQQQSSNFDDQISILQSLISKVQPPQISRVPQAAQVQQSQPVIQTQENQHHNQQYWANEDEVTLQGQVVNADSGSTQLKTQNNQVQVQDIQEAQDTYDEQQQQQQFVQEEQIHQQPEEQQIHQEVEEENNEQEKEIAPPPPPPKKQQTKKENKEAFAHPKLAHKQQHQEHHQQIQQANPFREEEQPKQVRTKQVSRRANVPGSLFD